MQQCFFNKVFPPNAVCLPMDPLARLTKADRRFVQKVTMRMLQRLCPRQAKQILRIVDLVRDGNAPMSSINYSVQTLVGRDRFLLLRNRIIALFIDGRVKKRTMVTPSGNLCHACMSYESTVKCATCDNVRFCYGCWDYGPCHACEDNPDSGKETKPPYAAPTLAADAAPAPRDATEVV